MKKKTSSFDVADFFKRYGTKEDLKKLSKLFSMINDPDYNDHVMILQQELEDRVIELQEQNRII